MSVDSKAPKKILISSKIDFHTPENSYIDRNEYNQIYLKEIMQKRIPDVEFVVFDSEQRISDHINKFLPVADEELASEMKLYSEMQQLYHDSRFQYMKKNSKNEFLDTIKQTHGIQGVVLFMEVPTYPPERKITTFKNPKIKTDISGIIIPIGHADHRKFLDILFNLKGLFKEQIMTFRQEYETNNNKRDQDYQYRHMKENIESHFYARFKIPVFQSHHFAPGDRFNNAPVGTSVYWNAKENPYSNLSSTPQLYREDYIKFAFNEWIEQNYLNKKQKD
jgi:hypothetical protein